MGCDSRHVEEEQQPRSVFDIGMHRGSRGGDLRMAARVRQGKFWLSPSRQNAKSPYFLHYFRDNLSGIRPRVPWCHKCIVRSLLARDSDGYTRVYCNQDNLLSALFRMIHEAVTISFVRDDMMIRGMGTDAGCAG